ncbi:hypothetical protein IAT38_007236 [Cryptococcus sp. DSM 104549]
MVSSFAYITALLPVFATLVSASNPILEGCISSGSAPIDSIAVSAISATHCASQCWSRVEGSRYAFWDWQGDDRCMCSSAPAEGKDFTMVNDEETYGTCAVGVAVYARVPQVPEFQVEKRSKSMEKLRLVRETVESLCPSPLTACAVAGDATSYECLDTTVELDSCGGCVNGVFGSGSTAVSGTDCTSLTGVASNAVACWQSKCRAFRCADGYKLAGNHTCVAK